MARNEPALAESVCLALVCEGRTHGWALAQLLAPDGDIGRVWRLSRPLTYRALDQLVARGAIARSGSEPGRGRARTVLAATAAGRRANRRWLDQPVGHLRDVRTELLVKLELRRRAGMDRVALIEAQQAVFGPLVDSLVEGPDDDLAAVWRQESARSVSRFLERARAASS